MNMCIKCLYVNKNGKLRRWKNCGTRISLFWEKWSKALKIKGKTDVENSVENVYNSVLIKIIAEFM
jgi:hypothetical protein